VGGGGGWVFRDDKSEKIDTKLELVRTLDPIGRRRQDGKIKGEGKKKKKRLADSRETEDAKSEGTSLRHSPFEKELRLKVSRRLIRSKMGRRRTSKFRGGQGRSGEIKGDSARTRILGGIEKRAVIGRISTSKLNAQSDWKNC